MFEGFWHVVHWKGMFFDDWMGVCFHSGCVNWLGTCIVQAGDDTVIQQANRRAGSWLCMRPGRLRKALYSRRVFYGRSCVHKKPYLGRSYAKKGSKESTG